MTSQRVAPRASAPSFVALGVAFSAVRESAAIVGSTMIASTKEAGRKHGPDEGVEKSGNQPIFALSQLPTGLVIGMTTARPQRP